VGSVAYKASDYLKTPEDIAAYIEVAMEDADERVILLALRQAADSIGGMSELARRAGLTREAVYKALGPDGNPRFSSLLAILHAFQLGLTVTHRNAA
jgi:probable addiction module antidote protein